MQNKINFVLSVIALGAGFLGIFTANASMTPNQAGLLVVATAGCFFGGVYLFFYPDLVAERLARAALLAGEKKPCC